MEELQPPRFSELGPLLIAGLRESYTDATFKAIPAQWQRFVPHLGHIPGQMGGVTYGIIMPAGKGDVWDYICGVEVSDFSNLSSEFCRLNLAKQRYAVFAHPGLLATFHDTMTQIWTKCVPELKLAVAKAPRLEIYAESFNPNRPGGIEIWIPIGE
jgi:AraC family transcriptional regulator